jgi:hypothetical protein
LSSSSFRAPSSCRHNKGNAECGNRQARQHGTGGGGVQCSLPTK